ncbi:MarR family winged helix-turn-helix transcriptional regulator [Nocardioides sp. Kera G14]|uniref:MarR family winged helix-turn-helix transcriptional regulator n=1 Tax=Nocardioides sp. Kera G14 TaxID=2884264 RepID=UPI001D107B9B|nr:MarR family transcriptional regulator [Nocardioides sp. Kera G14]UDY25206.1 MarR family transcriptional regulator [Nocardioides sp. Kera G14]
MSESTVSDVGVTTGEPASLTLLLKRSEDALHRRLQATLDGEGLLLEQWQIMAVLLARPGLRMSEIADAAVVPPATLTRHMDKLVERAIVVRRIDPDDKRRVVAALSPRGASLARRLSEVEQSIETALADGLGHERYEALAAELRLIPHLFD